MRLLELTRRLAASSRWRRPASALRVLRTRRGLRDLDAEPGSIWLAMHVPDPTDLTDALAHWRGQGVTHALICSSVPLPAEQLPADFTLGWVPPAAGLSETEIWQLLTDWSARNQAAWVIPCLPDQRWFAETGSLSSVLGSWAGNRATAEVFDVRRSDALWLLDKTRQRAAITAFRPRLGLVVGPGAAWVAGLPEGQPVASLRCLRLGQGPPRGREVAIDWPNWLTWDPAGTVGPAVVAGQNLPGTRHRASRVATLVRPGPAVITPAAWMGFGNLLYLLLAAHHRNDGTRVVITAALRPWLAHFPRLRDLVIEPDRVRVWHRREDPMLRTYGGFGIDFTKAQLQVFIRACLADAPMFADSPTKPVPTSSLVINIRRGDYYREPEFQEAYGFDQVDYLQRAMARVTATSARVVSDDVSWCREHLAWLTDRVDLSYADPQDTPADNFRDVATAQSAIITNSTFSYWAAHVGDVLHADDPGRRVVAPWFFSRAELGGRAYQLDPSWQIIDETDWNGSIGEPG